jgi:hypothetical protein
MTLQIEQTTLGPEGLAYLEEQLASGRGLSTRLLAHIKARRGLVRTWLPVGIDEKAKARLHTGGVMPEGVMYEITGGRMAEVLSLDDVLIDRIVRFLQERDNAVVVFEHALASASDPWITQARSRVLTSGDEVYHLLVRQDRDRHAIQAAIREARAIPEFIGVMTETAGPLASGHGEQLSAADLDALADRCTDIICGAYDLEGFIVWTED